MLRMNQNVQFRSEYLVLHIDPDAQFRALRPGCFFGIFSKKIYRFECVHGRREINYDGFGTEEQYEAVLTTQRQMPVPLTTDYNSGRTWWMFQDTFYWEDYSKSEIVDQGGAKDDVKTVVRAVFLEGDRGPHGISGEIYRFNCKQRGEEIEYDRVWTLAQYETLLEKQQENPIHLISDGESSRTWWMFRDMYYWDDENLKEYEVKARLSKRIRKQKSEIERELRLMERHN